MYILAYCDSSRPVLIYVMQVNELLRCKEIAAENTDMLQDTLRMMYRVRS